jgi:hypothetical protein
MVRHSGATHKNEAVHDWSADFEGRDNLAFFRAALDALAQGRSRPGAPQGAGSNQPGPLVAIGLVGQRDLPGVTLRRAQSSLRWDLRPSLWSHAFMIVVPDGASGPVDDLEVSEVTLYSRAGRFPEPGYNAVTKANLGMYRDQHVDANAALIGVSMTAEEAQRVADRAIWDFNVDRLRYNLWEMLGAWQAYFWQRGIRDNPLIEGIPMFSSAFVEYCFEAIQLDMAPGASERNSAPEHLWNGALWWAKTFEAYGHPISGYAVIRDAGCSQLGLDDQVTSRPATPETS